MTPEQLVAALTESQMDKVLDLISATLHAIREGISTAWVALSPALVAYLTWRQHANNKARKEGQKAIADEVEKNTKITEEVKTTISEFEQLRKMTTLAKKLGSTEPVFFPVKLPGESYEVFGLSEGSKVYWRNEPTGTGKAARFLVEGPCSMGFHFHQITEILSGVRGTLFYETGTEIVEITPNVVYTTPPDTVHSARFDAPGEVVVHWPDQVGDQLIIGVWP